MFNKEKAIDLYVVTPNMGNKKEFDLSNVVFYTITSKKKDCEEYINRRVFIENREHYVSWCGIRGLNYKDDKSWEQYITTSDININKYVISKINYKIKDVATIFRLFNHCVPVGASYEEEYEVIQLLQSIPKKSLDKIEKELASKQEKVSE